MNDDDAKNFNLIRVDHCVPLTSNNYAFLKTKDNDLCMLLKTVGPQTLDSYGKVFV